MALTPFLNEAGRRAASFIEEKSDAENVGLFFQDLQFWQLCALRHIRTCA